MRRGPVQDRTVILKRQQTLSTARRHSLSELFQLLHSFVRAAVNEQNKKRGPSQRKEKALLSPETTYPLLVPSRLLRVREAWNHQYEGSLKIEKGG